ncbi:MAG TPA: lamin tail domain-containing protein, partial [Spirochaetota bacterium]|nr:lamin tail domain-containing protein [Spirochaetota bacterium]
SINDWHITVSTAMDNDSSTNYWFVKSNFFYGLDPGGVCTWETAPVEPGTNDYLYFSLFLHQLGQGATTAAEYLKIFRQLDQKQPQLVKEINHTNQHLYSNTSFCSALIPTATGKTFKLVIKININGTADGWAFGNVTVKGGCFSNQPEDIIINEVCDPDDYYAGFVELYNNSTKSVNLDFWQLVYFNYNSGSSNPGYNTNRQKLSGLIEPGGFMVLTRNGSHFYEKYARKAHFTNSGFYIISRGDSLLLQKGYKTADCFNNYPPGNTNLALANRCYERIRSNSGQDITNDWIISPRQTNGTPGSSNCFTLSLSNSNYYYAPQPGIFTHTVKADNKNEYLTITNPDSGYLPRGNSAASIYLRDLHQSGIISTGQEHSTAVFSSNTQKSFYDISWFVERENNCWVTPDTRVVWAGAAVEIKLSNNRQNYCFLRYFHPAKSSYSELPSDTGSIRYIMLPALDQAASWFHISNRSLSSDIGNIWPDINPVPVAVNYGLLLKKPAAQAEEEVRFKAVFADLTITSHTHPVVIINTLTNAAWTNHKTLLPLGKITIKSPCSNWMLSDISLQNSGTALYRAHFAALYLHYDTGITGKYTSENTAAAFKNADEPNVFHISNAKLDIKQPPKSTDFLITALLCSNSPDCSFSFFLPADSITLTNQSLAAAYTAPDTETYLHDPIPVYSYYSVSTENRYIKNTLLQPTEPALLFSRLRPDTVIYIYSPLLDLIARLECPCNKGQWKIPANTAAGIYTVIFKTPQTKPQKQHVIIKR